MVEVKKLFWSRGVDFNQTYLKIFPTVDEQAVGNILLFFLGTKILDWEYYLGGFNL